MARVGDAKHVDQVFDRQSLTGLDFGDIDSLIDRYLRSLEVASSDITIGSGFLKNNYGVLLAGVVPEVLSRLSSKCSIASQERLIEFLLSAYRSDNRQAFQGIDHLAVRMLNALSMKQRIDLIPKLIALPILDDLPEMVKSEYPNPFELLVIERDLVGNMSSVPDDTVVKLIEAVASDNQPAREWAASTLGSLHYWGLLSSGLTAQFADALWKQVDDNGVPSKTRYPPHGFLMLPHPSTVDPIAVFKNWARMQRFPIQKDDARVSLTFGGGSLCREIVAASRHLEWSDDEVNTIVRRLVAWWDADKKHLHQRDPKGPLWSTREHFASMFSELMDTLGAVIRARFDPPDGSEARTTLRRLFKEFSEHGLPALRLEIVCLHLFPEQGEDLVQRVEDSLTSSLEDVASDALHAVGGLSERLGHEAEDMAKETLCRLLRMVAQLLRWRRPTRLWDAIDTMTVAIKRHPWSFADDVERWVLDGLRHIAADTIIQGPQVAQAPTKGDRWEVFTKLMVRERAASLAYTLGKHYAKQGGSIPDVIPQWESICRSDDEFAEVRNQWISPIPGLR